MSGRLFDPMDKRTRTFPFAYVPAASTDVSATWAKARARLEAKRREQAVRPIKRTGT